MAFHLRVYDNFHYTDETEADDIGSYAAYEEDEIEAKAIVDKFFICIIAQRFHQPQADNQCPQILQKIITHDIPFIDNLAKRSLIHNDEAKRFS